MPITDDMLDAKTPPEVEITAEAAPPIADPTLGIAVVVDRREHPRHRLVTIGDSLTHGFQSGAIFNTQLSYPRIIAWEMGWDDHFRYPTYDGQGGLPLNIEFLIRYLERFHGDEINWWEIPAAAFRTRQFMAEVEDWWERGPGSRVPNEKGIKHNLAVYGWDLRDALSRNYDFCARTIEQPKDALFRQVVENANERAALRVLNTSRDAAGKALSPIESARELGNDGSLENPAGEGIETLIVLLGANNSLSSVVQLKVVWSESPDFRDLNLKSRFTIWNPMHFEEELRNVANEVARIRARHVIWGTVPHVTIAPIARGVDRKVRTNSRYFPYYTRPWITDQQFDRTDDPHITEQEARAIDSAIDQYNNSITEMVRQARQQGRDWYVLDVAGILDRLAARRYYDSPAARPDWWTPYELPPDLAALNPIPDSRFFAADKNGRTAGGLFSLDGVHPTTICYGILAQEIIRVMERAGVEFFMGDGRTVRPAPVAVDFRRLIRHDTLVSQPPRSLSSDMRWAGRIDETFDFFSRLFRRGA